MNLSILIPVYNSEGIIEDLVKQIIDSISNIKTVHAYEIILIDNCSPDNCWKKIENRINVKKTFMPTPAIITKNRC